MNNIFSLGSIDSTSSEYFSRELSEIFFSNIFASIFNSNLLWSLNATKGEKT